MIANSKNVVSQEPMATKGLIIMRPSMNFRSVSANAQLTQIVTQVTKVASFPMNVRLSLDSKTVRSIELEFVHRLKFVQHFKVPSCSPAPKTSKDTPSQINIR